MEPNLNDIDDYNHPIARQKMLNIGIFIATLVIFYETFLFTVNLYLK